MRAFAKTSRIFNLFNILCVSIALAAASGAEAQTYPSKTISLIVGYSPGGQADALARVVAKRLGENLNTSVIVENKPGANGMIAAQLVAQSPADGYAILFVTDAMATIDPHLPSSGKFDLAASMEPLISMASAPLFLAANKDVPANTLRELVALSKTKDLSFGTSGSTTPHRLAGEMLQKRGNFKMLHVPYKGTSASVNDLLGGQISLVFGAATALEPLASAGKIKLIAVTSEKRYPQLPEVPAISETFEGFNLVSYLGLMVPKGTPADVVATLNREVNRVLSNAETRGWMEKQGMIPIGGSSADFRKQIEVDYKSRGEIIREVGMTPD
jgi:tripartite-type tricarboxylate transporter receptor subunit TctC